MKHLHFLIILLIAIRCGDTKVVNVSNETECKENGWALLKSGAKTFALDGLSTKHPACFQFLTLDEVEGEGEMSYFTFLNALEYSIYFYDYETSKYLFKVKLEPEGPNGVPGMTGYTIKNMDTIALYGDRDAWRFNLINAKGRKLHSFDYSPELHGDIKYPPYPEVGSHQLIYFRNGEMITAGYRRMEFDDDNAENRKVITFFNIQSNNPKEIITRHEVSYPDLFYKGNWWGNFFHQPFYCFNEEKDLLAVSFPASHKITVYDIMKDRISEYEAGSCHIREISSSAEEYQQNGKEKEKSMHHFLENDRYSHILFDPYRNCYYRFAVKHATNPDPLQQSSFLTEVYVIILDDKFQYKGETTLSGNEYGVGGVSFVTPDGLLLAYYADKAEDRMLFHVFKLNKNSSI